MVYIITLDAGQVGQYEREWKLTARFTKAVAAQTMAAHSRPQLAIILARGQDYRSQDTGAGSAERQRHLVWMGVVHRVNTVGQADKTITIDPLRQCDPVVRLDGGDGLLRYVQWPHLDAFESNQLESVTQCDPTAWHEFERVLRSRHPALGPLLDWLTAQVDAPVLRGDDPADLAWWEEHDSVGTAARIGGFSPTAFAGWHRPHSPDAPYLAGLIPEPVEHSLIDHDLHAPEIFGELRDNPNLRSDIHVLVAPDGRRLEIANVNATPVEGRLGTDLIYYHEPTRSFILVQYKRISLTNKTITVDARLRRQLDRLEAVASLSQAPARPHDWRMGADACFLKLAKWPAEGQLSQELANGMYLPLSYVRLLLEDDCTLGPRGGRVLGYGTVERHLTGAQFIQLIQHGLAGTVGTTVEQLKRFSIQRAEQDRTGVVIAAERGSETVRQRQQRVNSRSPKKRARTRSR